MLEPKHAATKTARLRNLNSMDTQSYIVLFNISAFAVVWWELKRQERRRHDQIDRISGQLAGLTLIAMDHGHRIAEIEKSPFRPAAILEKMDMDTADADTQRMLQDIKRFLSKSRTKEKQRFSSIP